MLYILFFMRMWFRFFFTFLRILKFDLSRFTITSLSNTFPNEYNERTAEKGYIPGGRTARKVVVIRFSDFFPFAPASLTLHISVLTAVLGGIKTIPRKTSEMKLLKRVAGIGKPSPADVNSTMNVPWTILTSGVRKRIITEPLCYCTVYIQYDYVTCSRV